MESCAWPSTEKCGWKEKIHPELQPLGEPFMWLPNPQPFQQLASALFTHPNFGLLMPLPSLSRAWSHLRPLPISCSDNVDSQRHQEVGCMQRLGDGSRQPWARGPQSQEEARHFVPTSLIWAWGLRCTRKPVFSYSKRKGQRAEACSRREWPLLNCPSLTFFSLSLF